MQEFVIGAKVKLRRVEKTRYTTNHSYYNSPFGIIVLIIDEYLGLVIVNWANNEGDIKNSDDHEAYYLPFELGSDKYDAEIELYYEEPLYNIDIILNNLNKLEVKCLK